MSGSSRADSSVTRRLVSGVRSWCEASSLKVRSRVSMRSRRDAVVSSASATASTSWTPLFSVRTVKSPCPSSAALVARRATGRARRRDCQNATSPLVSSASTAMAAITRIALCVRSVTTDIGVEARSAPTTCSPR